MENLTVDELTLFDLGVELRTLARQHHTGFSEEEGANYVRIFKAMCSLYDTIENQRCSEIIDMVVSLHPCGKTDTY